MNSTFGDMPALFIACALIALVALFIWLWRLGARANEVDWGGPLINRIDGLGRLLCYRYHRLHGDHIYLPDSGPAILVANHISGLDPFLLIAASRRRLRFIIATEQYHRFGLNWLFRASGCIPVDRVGRPERAFRAALRALEAGEVVALFPHGAIHLDSDPHRKLKSGAVRLAQLAGCPIIPARIDGVRAAGGIFWPLVLRGHARVSNFPVIECAGHGVRECLQELENVLVRRPDGEG